MVLFFFETDCPTCRLSVPYINRLAAHTPVTGISQDSASATAAFQSDVDVRFPVQVDENLTLSRAYDPVSVPALYVLGTSGQVLRSTVGFDKNELNAIASMVGVGSVADPYDGAPAMKPGCVSRHREDASASDAAPVAGVFGGRGTPASLIELDESVDPFEFCAQTFRDPLPVIPPTRERVGRMLAATNLPPHDVIARIPPNYGAATVEKIAANAVMAGCRPELMQVLIPLIRAACDERFNLHGVQATTHFAAPLVILNGPVRRQLGFHCAGNVFSNVARANSTLGRAFQLILTNLGGARPAEIDMSTLGNPGKFSYVIGENEEASPWEPFQPRSAVTLFAAEPPRAVSEHTARTGRPLLTAIAATLATVWSWRVCLAPEAFVVLCPEHATTLARDGFSKLDVRQFLFDHTGIPVRAYDNDGGEGTQMASSYETIPIHGEPCYRKFRHIDQIQVIVAGGTAGKFSAVIGSWATGPRGSQIVTYPL